MITSKMKQTGELSLKIEGGVSRVENNLITAQDDQKHQEIAEGSESSINEIQQTQDIQRFIHQAIKPDKYRIAPMLVNLLVVIIGLVHIAGLAYKLPVI